MCASGWTRRVAHVGRGTCKVDRRTTTRAYIICAVLCWCCAVLCSCVRAQMDQTSRRADERAVRAYASIDQSKRASTLWAYSTLQLPTPTRTRARAAQRKYASMCALVQRDDGQTSASGMAIAIAIAVPTRGASAAHRPQCSQPLGPVRTRPMKGKKKAGADRARRTRAPERAARPLSLSPVRFASALVDGGPEQAGARRSTQSPRRRALTSRPHPTPPPIRACACVRGGVCPPKHAPRR